jgi:hypothetical protein
VSGPLSARLTKFAGEPTHGVGLHPLARRLVDEIDDYRRERATGQKPK